MVFSNITLGRSGCCLQPASPQGMLASVEQDQTASVLRQQQPRPPVGKFLSARDRHPEKSRAVRERDVQISPPPPHRPGFSPNVVSRRHEVDAANAPQGMAGIDGGADLSDGTAPIHMQLRHD